MNKILGFLSVLVLGTNTLAQTVYTSTGNGNWLTAGTWSGGVPASGSAAGNENIIIIQAGHTVTISGSNACDLNIQGTEVSLSHIVIYIWGTLHMAQISQTCGTFPLSYTNTEGLI